MGLEYVVLLFLLLFFTGGIAAPILLWASVTEAKRRRLKAGLLRLGATRIEDTAGPSADAPARLSFYVGEQIVHVDALIRGDELLWHVRLPVDRASVQVRFALVDRAWARPLAPARRMTPVARNPARPDDRFELRIAPGDDVTALDGRLAGALAALGGRPERLLQCVLNEEALAFEVTREDLSEREVLPWVERTLHFADALGLRGFVPPPVLRLPSSGGRIARSLSGNPVGLPG